MAAVPADCVWGEDNVTVSALDPGFKTYAGYWNGPFANMTALRARFPHAFLVSIALRLSGSKGSNAADVESGTFATDQAASFNACLAWLRQGDFGGRKPLIYVMASWARPLELFLGLHGWERNKYNLWTAHWIGQHLCSPGGCGYGNSTADGTQYASGTNDHSVFRGYVISGAPAPPPPVAPGVLRLGSTGPAVVAAQRRLNVWAKAVGYHVLVPDGDFGGKTYDAVRRFQAFRKLVVDGVIGPLTTAELNRTPPVTPKPPAPPPLQVPTGVPVLRRGMVGREVGAMQYYLRNSGIYGVRGIDADGSFGPQTETAVKNFQGWAHLTPDGVYGPATAKALAKEAAA